MKFRISAILLVLCLIFSTAMPENNASAYGQSFTASTVSTELPEIEPNHDDAAAMETVAAVIIIALVVCVVIYCCGTSD
mgnify:CR=1 FL=1